MPQTKDYDWTKVDAAGFWSQVEIKADILECWPWLGGTERGYGKYYLGDAATEVAKRYRYGWAPRICWELHHQAPFPRGKVARHRCDTRICTNPYHVIPGTNADNVRDMVVRGQNAKGERSGAAKHPESMGYTGKRAEYYFKKYGRTEPDPKTVARRGTWTPRIRKRKWLGTKRDGQPFEIPAEVMDAYIKAESSLDAIGQESPYPLTG